MANYVDWVYYNSRFPNVTETEFNLLNVQATAKIDIFTGRRSQVATDYKLVQLKDCVCNMINTISQQQKAQAGNGITSISNDGYSESYRNVTKDQADAELKSVAIQWLSGTGLMGVL